MEVRLQLDVYFEINSLLLFSERREKFIERNRKLEKYIKEFCSQSLSIHWWRAHDVEQGTSSKLASR